MTSFLPCELLTMIFDECADYPSTLHSCILVNRRWCAIALQHLWARPFTSLNSSPRIWLKFCQSVENLMTTFIECFTDVDSLENSAQLCKKYNKKFPVDY